MEILENAVKEGRSALSEYESKQVLETYHIPVTRERTVTDVNGLRAAMEEIGFPPCVKRVFTRYCPQNGKRVDPGGYQERRRGARSL